MSTIQTKRDVIAFWTRPSWLLKLLALFLAGGLFAVLSTLTDLLVWWQSTVITGAVLLLVIGLLFSLEEIKRTNKK